MKQGWEIKKLGEVCNINYGTRVVQKKDGGTIYPVYGGGGATFKMDRYNREDCLIVSRFAMSNQCVRYVSGKFFLNDSGLTIESNESELSQSFLDKHITALNDTIYSLGKGVAQKNLDIKELRLLDIKYPKSREEQERIVEELDCLSGVIEKKREQLRELDALAQSIFYTMFGDPITNEKGFPVYQIDDIITFQGGSQPDKSHFEYEPTDDNIRLIQIRDYKSDKNITYIPKSLARRLCNAEDIMIGRYGPPIFQILKGIEGAYNVALMKAIPKQGNREFIRAFLKQKCLLEYLESMSKRTAGQDGIQMDKLKAYPFPLPPIELQEEFAGKIALIEKQQEIIKKSIAQTEELFNARMNYYFN